MWVGVPLQRPPRWLASSIVSLIGSGGYADVFLYQQAMPTSPCCGQGARHGSAARGSGQSDFTAEANLMASVSAHPYIVQVFHADIAPDGRPYLIMEYYSGPELLRSGPLGEDVGRRGAASRRSARPAPSRRLTAAESSIATSSRRTS